MCSEWAPNARKVSLRPVANRFQNGFAKPLLEQRFALKRLLGNCCCGGNCTNTVSLHEKCPEYFSWKKSFSATWTNHYHSAVRGTQLNTLVAFSGLSKLSNHELACNLITFFLILQRFHSITRQTFHKAHAFLLMYDVTSSQSFSAVSYWASCIQVCCHWFGL